MAMGGSSRKSGSKNGAKPAQAQPADGEHGAAAAAAATANPIQACKQADQLIQSLLHGPTSALLVGPQLQNLCSTLQQVALEAAGAPETSTLRGMVLSCTCHLPQLVLMLLSARKHPRDWRQLEYSSRVCSLLAAATAVLRLTGLSQTGKLTTFCGVLLLPTTHYVARSDLLQQTVSAQQEVCQLLLSSREQQQQQQQQQEATQLQQLAKHLLCWWLEVHGLWLVGADPSVPAPAGPSAFQLPAIELAAALLPTLQAGSQPELFLAVAKVTYRVFTWPIFDKGLGLCEDVRILLSSFAFLELSLAMLLVHSSWLHASAAADVPGGYSSVSSDSPRAAGSKNSSSKVNGESSSSSSSSSSNTNRAGDSSHQTGTDTQQILASLAATAGWMWQAAGWQACALGQFGRVINADLPSLLSCCNVGHYKPLLAMHTTHLQGFLVATRACKDCLLDSFLENHSAHESDADTIFLECPMLHFAELPQRKQQLLQACVFLLPHYLLEVARLHGNGQSAVVEIASGTAGAALAGWGMEGLHDAATAAAAASIGAAAVQHDRGAPQHAAAATVSTVQQPPQLVLALLDSWLQLLQQLLLQQPVGLLVQAAATAHQMSPDELQRTLGSTCRCCLEGATSYRFPGAAISCQRCITLSCDGCDGLSALLMLLTQLAMFSRQLLPDERWQEGLLSVWRSRAVAVMLMLEVLVRQLLPNHILCRRNAGSDQGKSQNSGSMAGSNRHSTKAAAAAGQCIAGAIHYLHLCLSVCLHSATNATVLELMNMSFTNQPQPAPAFTKQQHPAPELPEPHLCALIASVLKQCRCLPELSGNIALAQSASLGSWEILWRLLEYYQAPLEGPAASSQVQRACLAPWLFLGGAFLQQAGLWLQAWRDHGCSGRDVTTELRDVLGLITATAKVSAHIEQYIRLWADVDSSDEQHSADEQSGQDSRSCQSGQQAAPAPAQQQQQQQQQQEDLAHAAMTAASGLVAPQLLPLYRPDCLQDELQLLKEGPQGKVHLFLGSSYNTVYAAVYRAKQLLDKPAGSGCSNTGACHLGGAPGAELHHFLGHDNLYDEWILGFPDEHKGPAYIQSLYNEMRQVARPTDCWTRCMGSVPLRVLSQVLQTAGRSLCNKLPVPWLCNNPDCTNMEGASELQLVGGSSCVCGACRVARYCSRDCQASHWLQHKPACQELSAAAAAAEAVGAGTDTAAGGAAASPGSKSN